MLKLKGSNSSFAVEYPGLTLAVIETSYK